MTVTRIDYQTLLENIRNEIYNGGANLNQNLSTSVQQVIYGDPNNIAVAANMYPTVFIQLQGMEEAWETLGSVGSGDGGQKTAAIKFSAFCFVIKSSGSDDSDKEIRYLASNIEGLIRNNVRLSNTSNLLWITPTSTNFVDSWRDGIYLSSATMAFECKVDVK